jgi:hypothetical protein
MNNNDFESKSEKEIVKTNESFKKRKNHYLKKIIINIIRLCHSYYNSLDTSIVVYKKNSLEDFSPTILTNEEDKYSHIIKEAIENKNVKNLALTGPHSSGKSTILKTFEYNHKEYKYLDLSLATFNGEKFESEDIERNILKQLFYSVEHKKIPESRIKRIENIKRIKIKTILLLLWLASSSYFFKIEFINKLKTILHLNFYNKTLSIVYSIYFIIGVVYLLNKFLNFILNFKLTKFKFNDVDFDDNQDKKTINFENEIDEIIYFFEMNKIDIVFIQDLDRFNESEIFIKLREINNLINNYEPIKTNRKITFMYAISDDVFKNDERTKFFDLIIPVIPVINYSNSSSKLLEKLSDDICNNKLSKEFIDDVSLFINDFRIIKSIINEYNVYKKIIGKELENYNNLLAIMIYKNIEPKDFEKLNRNKGYVYDILNNSFKLINKTLQNIDKKVEKLNNEMQLSENEKIKNIQELRMLYIYKFFELLNKDEYKNFHAFSIDNKKISYNEIISDENFSMFIGLENITYYETNHYSKVSSYISFSDIEKNYGEKYFDRTKVIENKNIPNRIESALDELEIQKNEIKIKKFFELISDDNSIEYFKDYSENEENAHINNLKLINYLLTTGYINEDYNHYISYFHPGSITKEDNDFLISLLPSEKSLPFNYKLYEKNSLFSKIKSVDYSKVSILNFSLLDYLIETNNLEKINLIIKLLKKQNKNSIQFIEQYLQATTENNRGYFLINLTEEFSSFWNLVFLKSDFSIKKIEIYLQYIFKYINDELLQKIDKNHILSDHISKLERLDFLDENVNIESFKKFLKHSAVEFENLEYKEEQKDLFEFIYEEYIYRINYKMIEFFISDYYNDIEVIEKLKKSNYTTIKNSNKEKLIVFIDDNIEVYLNNILLKLDNNNNESQESVLAILNNSKVIEKTKIEFIKKVSFSIKELLKIKDLKIREILLKQNKIDIKWSNIIIFYLGENAFSDVLVNYLNINEHYKLLSKDIIKYSEESIESNFTSDLINSNISLEAFSFLINSLSSQYNDGSQFSEIDESKMKLLIESKTIRLTKENFELIYEKFENLLIPLLEKNLTTYMNDYENYNLSYSNIIAIIDSKIFKPNQKKIIIENIDKKTLISNKNLLIKLGDFISDNKINISQRNLEEVISNTKSLTNKIKITNLYFGTIQKENIRNIIIQIGKPISNLLSGKHIEIENTFENKKLTLNLKKHLVSSSKTNEKTNTIKLIPYKKLNI